MQIATIEDLRNTDRIEKFCTETKAPVFVTKNGSCKFVIMDMDCFERLMMDPLEAKLINEGLQDLKSGKTVDGKKTLDDMATKYGF